VIRSHWRVVAGWAAFNLIAMVAVVIVAAVVVFALVVSGAVSDAALSSVGSFVAIGGDMLVQTVVGVGLYRLMFRPQEPAFLHLRLGRDEGRIVAIGTVLLLGAAAIGYLAYRAGQALAHDFSAAPALAGLLALGVVIWLGLRLGLTAPLSFVEGRIDFARAWRLTRGQGWTLFGMWLLNLVVVLMVWVAWWVAAFVVMGALTGFGGSGEGAEAFTAHPARYLLEGASPLLFAPVILVLQQTPWIVAYRALAKPEPA
jgi:hypothetical protein